MIECLIVHLSITLSKIVEKTQITAESNCFFSSLGPTGQQWNPLQGENDDAPEEAEGILQPETGMNETTNSCCTLGHKFDSQELIKHRTMNTVALNTVVLPHERKVSLMSVFLQGVPASTLRFLFEGQRIADSQTPKEVNYHLLTSAAFSFVYDWRDEAD